MDCLETRNDASTQQSPTHVDDVNDEPHGGSTAADL